MHRWALLVNPHDQEGMAEALYAAVMMGPQEQRTRMRRLRHGVRTYDVFWWLDMFLKASTEPDCELSAPPEELDLMAILPPASLVTPDVPLAPTPISRAAPQSVQPETPSLLP